MAGCSTHLLALAVLALNDHVLKQAAPGVVTGKLSDLAGLVLTPALLAVVLAVLRVPRAAPVALVATAVAFTVVKTTVSGVEAANAVWSWVGWPTQILRDPTDLLALPALLLAALVSRSERRRVPGARHRVGLALGALALPFAVVATAATSPCYTTPGLDDVGVVRGDWSGPPAGAENRLVVPLSYRPVSIDADGRLRTLSKVDDARVADVGPRLAQACSVTEPRRCWRGAPGAKEPWVEATTDGGTTWSTDYRMPARELTQVREAAGGTCDDEPLPVAPRDLAVLDTLTVPWWPWRRVARGCSSGTATARGATWTTTRSRVSRGRRPPQTPTSSSRRSNRPPPPPGLPAGHRDRRRGCRPRRDRPPPAPPATW